MQIIAVGLNPTVGTKSKNTIKFQDPWKNSKKISVDQTKSSVNHPVRLAFFRRELDILASPSRLLARPASVEPPDWL
jgi:hypothetical protein